MIFLWQAPKLCDRLKLEMVMELSKKKHVQSVTNPIAPQVSTYVSNKKNMQKKNTCKNVSKILSCLIGGGGTFWAGK